MSVNAESGRNQSSTEASTSPRRVLFLCAAALAAGIGIAEWLEVRGSKSYGGTLQSRATTISAEQPAKIQEILVTAGQRIVPGDRLLSLCDDRLESQIRQKQQLVVELSAEMKRVEAQAAMELEWRRRELNGEIFQTQLKVETMTHDRTAREVEQLAWQDFLKDLPTGGSQVTEAVLPARSVILDSPLTDERRLQAMLREDAAAAAAESLSQQLVLCEQQLKRLRDLQQGLPERVRVSAGVELAETRLTQARGELAGLEKQRDALTIVSSAHGLVGRIHRQPGDLVSPGDAMIELLDDERRHLIASIPSSAATRLQPGTRVELVFPGEQNRIGLVAAIPPHAVPANPLAALDSQVEVKVEPAGKLWPKLPVGSRVQVHVLQ